MYSKSHVFTFVIVVLIFSISKSVVQSTGNLSTTTVSVSVTTSSSTGATPAATSATIVARTETNSSTRNVPTDALTSTTNVPTATSTSSTTVSMPEDIEYNGSCYENITSDLQCYTPNATCKEGRCKCPDDFFFLNNTSCVKKVEYNGSCYENITSYLQCYTPNATCKEGRCKCPDDFFFLNNTSCVKKVEYNGSCNAKIVSEQQCLTPNATCQEGRCKCTDDFFFLKNTSCVKKVEYNGSCYENITSDLQCYTPNATCQEGRCKCPDDFFFSNNTSCVKKPLAPENPGRFENVTESSFIVLFGFNDSLRFTHHHVVINPNSSSISSTVCEDIVHKSCTFERNKNITSITFSGLKPGTNYTVYFYRSIGNLSSANGPSASTYTRPLAPENPGTFENVTESSFIVLFGFNDSLRFTHHHVVINPNSSSISSTVCEDIVNKSCTFERNENITSITFSGLKPGTNYTVYFYRSIGNLSSANGPPASTYTRPLAPENPGTFENVTESSFIVLFGFNDSLRFTHHHVVINPNSSSISSTVCKDIVNKSCTFERNENITSITFSGLKPGTNYTVYFYRSIGNLSSANGPSASTYTRPLAPENPGTFENVTESSFIVLFGFNDSLRFTHHHVVINPNSSSISSTVCEDIVNKSCTFERNENITSITFSGLKPGTNYTVYFYRSVGNLSSANGPPASTYTRPLAPENPGTFENVTESSFIVLFGFNDSLRFTHHHVVINPNSSSISSTVCEDIVNKSCTFERNENITSITFSGLKPGTNYTVYFYRSIGNLSSANGPSASTYTRPLAPENPGTFENVTESSFIVLFGFNDSLRFTHHHVVINPNSSSISSTVCEDIVNKSCTFERNENITSITFSGLKPGTNYTVYFYRSIDNLSSANGPSASTYTIPRTPKVIEIQESSTTNDSLKVEYRDPLSDFTDWILNIYIASNDSYLLYSRKATKNNTSVLMDELNPGTKYKIVVLTNVYGFNSSEKTIFAFTRPSPPSSFEIPKNQVFGNNLTVTFGVFDDMYDFFQLEICNETCDNDTQKKDVLNKTVIGLNPASFYTVRLYTVINTTDQATLYSEFPVEEKSFTAPNKPNAELNHTSFTNVLIDISENSGVLFDRYRIDYTINGTEQEKPFERNDLNANITGLTPGTSYKFKVYTVLTGISSENFTKIQTFTRPAEVLNVTVENTTMDSIQIKWFKPAVGFADSYEVNFTCKGPNKNSSPLTEPIPNTTKLEATINDIEPGSYCNVTITTFIETQIGRPLFIPLNESSNEAAPNAPTFSNINPLKRSMEVFWSEPTEPNGVVRKYQLLVKDTKFACYVASFIYNCHTCLDNEVECQNASSPDINMCDGADNNIPIVNESLQSHQIVKQLHPYRKYGVAVRAYTNCWGNLTWTYNQTESDIPSAAPKVTKLTPSQKGFSIELNPPDEEDRNGVITKYTIRYAWKNHTCWDSNNGDTVVETKDTPINSSVLEVSDLLPYWYYNITVRAFTKVGEGPFGWCEDCLLRTKESIPGDVRNFNVNTTSDSASFTWITPCRTNGVITEYMIKIKNNDKNITWTNNTGGNMTQFTEIGLLPYSNYSFSIAAHTKEGQGTFTVEENKRTEIDKPREPTNPKAKEIDSTSLQVTWNTPNLFTGPTRYIVIPVDVKNSSVKLNFCEVTGFEVKTCNLTGLDEYWTYSITVIALTEKGNTSSITFSGQTAQDKPGKIRDLVLTPEKNVTKERSVSVKWSKPKERDQNGIIKKYYVDFTDKKNKTYSFATKNNATTNLVFRRMHPGTYKIKVFGYTDAGNGTFDTREVIVEPGAPLKPNEDAGHLLMRQSTKQPTDKEKQITVLLPLKSFLCNSSNGDVESLGVIVAQKDQATDNPFSGSKEDFDKKKKEVYSNWFKVKDMDHIPPYVATPSNWTVQCRSNGNRRKRDVSEQETLTFTVGEAGKCSGIDNTAYCNGELKPGRSYMVKVFACTSRGCTETKYSEPISTAMQKITDPDLTIAIAAGISAAVVVIVIIAVVTFILRRKQLVCFAKDDEVLHTHTPGEDIRLDKIEHTKKNHFRQGAIKLSDFPAAVDKFHKDSDLLFADAYKLLKEKSPSHPMTAAEQQCCRPKNRYTNILPFDHSRVKLRPSDDMEGSDYINANYIPGYTSRREYIATQGPMQATFDDFWRMVWEQNVDTIVMLTKLMEKGRLKCDKYWPDLGEPVFYGDLVVSLNSESNLSDYTIKIFEIKMKEERKLVRHFSYLKWPDMGCPETPELLLEFVKAVKQYGNREKSSSGPTIVHCSAGVGRTGTFIAVDYLLQHIRDHDEVDIFNLVLEMRNHRLNMVQTEDQYIYIHECLKAFITTDEEEEEDDDEAVYVNTGFGADEENIYENT